MASYASVLLIIAIAVCGITGEEGIRNKRTLLGGGYVQKSLTIGYNPIRDRLRGRPSIIQDSVHHIHEHPTIIEESQPTIIHSSPTIVRNRPTIIEGSTIYEREAHPTIIEESNPTIVQSSPTIIRNRPSIIDDSQYSHPIQSTIIKQRPSILTTQNNEYYENQRPTQQVIDEVSYDGGTMVQEEIQEEVVENVKQTIVEEKIPTIIRKKTPTYYKQTTKKQVIREQTPEIIQQERTHYVTETKPIYVTETKPVTVMEEKMVMNTRDRVIEVPGETIVTKGPSQVTYEQGQPSYNVIGESTYPLRNKQQTIGFRLFDSDKDTEQETPSAGVEGDDKEDKSWASKKKKIRHMLNDYDKYKKSHNLQ